MIFLSYRVGFSVWGEESFRPGLVVVGRCHAARVACRARDGILKGGVLNV